MVSKVNSNAQRQKRHRRVRAVISGTAARPRLGVFRSLNNIYAQLIDDSTGVTLVSASTQDEEARKRIAALPRGEDNTPAPTGTGNKTAARVVGKLLAEKAKKKGITQVVFDRGGYLYHGRVKELADGAREGGLEF